MALGKYILYTDTCIYWLKGERSVEEKILSDGIANVAITVVTECELYYGAFKATRREENLSVLDKLSFIIRTIHTSEAMAPIFGRARADLEHSGRPLDDADLMIASMAIASRRTPVTNNTKHFVRIRNLVVENWIG